MTSTQPDQIITFSDDTSKAYVFKPGEEDTVTEVTNFFLDSNVDHLDLGIMPPVVRSISSAFDEYSGNKAYLVMVERKPEVIDVVYNKKYDHYKLDDFNFAADAVRTPTSEVFKVPVPWQHWVLKMTYMPGWQHSIVVEQVALYFSQSKINNLDHVFYAAYMPNVFPPSLHPVSNNVTNGCCQYTNTAAAAYRMHTSVDDQLLNNLSHNICTNTSLTDLKLTAKIDFAELFNRLYDLFWFSRNFNADTCQNLCTFLNSYCDSKIPAHQMDVLQSIPFEDILDYEKIFKHLNPVFTYGDYLKHLAHASKPEFEFAQFLDTALDVGEIITIDREEQKRILREAQNKNKCIIAVGQDAEGITVYQWDPEGVWRYGNGKYAYAPGVVNYLTPPVKSVYEYLCGAHVQIPRHTAVYAGTTTNRITWQGVAANTNPISVSTATTVF